MKTLIFLSIFAMSCSHPKLRAFECGEAKQEYFDENGHAIQKEYSCREFYFSEAEKKDD